MSEDGFYLTPEQGNQARQALDISALNGIVSLAIILKKRGLIAPNEIEAVHESMTKPFCTPENANNPAVQDAQQNLDALFSVLFERR